MGFSIYTSAFLVNKNQFDIDTALKNFCHFAGQDGEVKVAVPFKDEDRTYESIEIWKSYHSGLSSNLEVFYAETDKSDPEFDGKLKNFALQQCSGPLCIGLDLDERVCIWQKDLWNNAGKTLLDSQFDAFFIPSIDLYQDNNHYKKIGVKWYFHKRYGLYRGVVNFAKLPNGHHDISKSDGCELININGDLAKTKAVYSDPTNIDILRTLRVPFVYHLGHIDIENRLLRNKNFWKEHWSTEAGKDVFIPTKIEEIEKIEVYQHKLPLWT